MPAPSGPPPRPETRVESEAEVREALHHLELEPTGPAVPAFKPTQRPPVPLLVVCDDGRRTGEVIRIRGTRFVIGRTEGDLLLGADELVSARHAEIVCQQVGGGFRWVVADLQSRNGLFLRVHRTNLTDGTEFLVGQGRYRFDLPAKAGGGETTDEIPGLADGSGTRGQDSQSELGPIVTELVGGATGPRIPLLGSEAWIGADPDCAVRRPSDPFVAPRHVRITFDRKKQTWRAANNRTDNGLWVRVPQVAVASECSFQIGEQRFRLTVGS
jgi:FHA domain